MDLVRWSDRVRHRVTERSMAAAKSLVHVLAIEQHCSQRQKHRPKPGTIHRTADCFHESGNSSAVARWIVLGVSVPAQAGAVWRLESYIWSCSPSSSSCMAKATTLHPRIRCFLQREVLH